LSIIFLDFNRIGFKNLQEDVKEEDENIQDVEASVEISQAKYLESFEESNLRGVKDSKRKIDEIRKKLEGVKRDSKVLDNSIQKDSFTY